MYNNPGGPFLPPTGARPGVASSPKSLGAGGGSFSPPPTHGAGSPGPFGAGFPPNGNNSFAPVAGGSGGFMNAGPVASPSFQAASPSFQVTNNSASFAVPNSAASFQVPNTGSLQNPANNGSFTGSASFAPAPRLPQAGSFTGPPILNAPAISPAAMRGVPRQGGSFEDARAQQMRPLNPMNHFGIGHVYGHGYGHGHAHGGHRECEDQQCAEEECDPQECGDENRAPVEEKLFFGVTRRQLMPVLLALSTLVGGIVMFVVQFPLIAEFDHYILRTFFVIVWATTLFSMGYCCFCDPGMVDKEEQRKAYARLHQSGGAPPSDSCAGEIVDEDVPLPKRCQKTWQYPQPIRRYDHYCRWLTNCIGLLNHREFIIMVAGLVVLGVSGALIDISLIVRLAEEKMHWMKALWLALHLGYCAALTSLAGPIFRLHVGFISRNELASEWKRNDFYVITNSLTGETVHVNDLEDDEFNKEFENFIYDKSRNSFDKDWRANCLTFWCTARWPKGQLGDF